MTQIKKRANTSTPASKPKMSPAIEEKSSEVSETEEVEKDQDVEQGEEVGPTDAYDRLTQSDNAPAKRKREADENDVAEETPQSGSGEEEDDTGNEKDVESTKVGGMKHQSTPPPALPGKKKQKKSSAAKEEQGDAPVLKKVAGDEKQDDDDGDVDPATEDMDICGSEKPSENPNKDKGNEEEEEEDQETAKNAKGKESKKKLASTTPKKTTTPKVKRTTKQPETKTRKVLAGETENEISVVPSDVAASKASKKGSEGNGQKSTTMTKAEMGILFDMVCGEMVWLSAASTLNARSSGAKHVAGNLKRHWTTTLRKRVVDGYSD